MTVPVDPRGSQMEVGLSRGHHAAERLLENPAKRIKSHLGAKGRGHRSPEVVWLCPINRPCDKDR